MDLVLLSRRSDAERWREIAPGAAVEPRVPVALPPLVGVIAFLYLWGESGVGTRLVTAALGLDRAPWGLSGAGAILLPIYRHLYAHRDYLGEEAKDRLLTTFRRLRLAAGFPRSAPGRA